MQVLRLARRQVRHKRNLNQLMFQFTSLGWLLRLFYHQDIKNFVKIICNTENFCNFVVAKHAEITDSYSLTNSRYCTNRIKNKQK